MAQRGSGPDHARRVRRAESELRKTDLVNRWAADRPKTGMALPIVVLGLLFLVSGFGTVSQAAAFGAAMIALGVVLIALGLRLYYKRV